MLPNLLTGFRLVALLPIMALLLPGTSPGARAAALAIFLLAGLTDCLDGALARRLKCASPVGVFFDPLADKVLADVLLVYLAAVEPGWANLWLVLLMLAREFAVQGFRSMAPCKGVVIRTRLPNKLKFVFEFAFIALVLAGLAWPGAESILKPAAQAMSWVTFVTAYVSMGTLFWQNRDLLSRPDARLEQR